MNRKLNLYQKILGFITKNGNKKKASLILNGCILRVSRETKLPMGSILLQIFSKLNSFAETRKVKSRHGVHLVPFFITYNRRLYLCTKWLMDSVKSDSRSISTEDKLFTEIMSILSDRQAKSLVKKKLNTKNVLRNRSNIHFRW